MEQNNLQIVAKKCWHMVRVAIFMLRKGILKSKLFSDFNIMMKRGKIAGKTIHNLMFHHGHQWAGASTATTTRHCHMHDYEFSCNNTPMQTFNVPKRRNTNCRLYDQKYLKNIRTDPNFHYPTAQSPEVVEDEIMSSEAVTKALEMLESATASPALPGFGRSPVVRQLRITDSPFSLNYCGEEDNHVDEAAEDFIKKFYNDLRRQNLVTAY